MGKITGPSNRDISDVFSKLFAFKRTDKIRGTDANASLPPEYHLTRAQVLIKSLSTPDSHLAARGVLMDIVAHLFWWYWIKLGDGCKSNTSDKSDSES